MNEVMKFGRNLFVLVAILSFLVATTILFEKSHQATLALVFVELLVFLFFFWILWRKRPRPYNSSIKKGSFEAVIFLFIGYAFGILIMMSKGSEFGRMTELMIPMGFYSVGLGALAFGMGMNTSEPKPE